ncbi:MAG: winged helix-turn-helix transcriptional regulator [Emticicia sp.]|uniref:winged helix-turn-helix transcriptional regulator n=1 Tax=Emticicia sp. TaxID=1930953 RepID=UPI003BA5ECC8
MGNQLTTEKVAECKNSVKAIHDVMDIIGGKWKISIIACLCYQPLRFSEILKEIEGISGKVLSKELKDLEMNQLVTRTVLDTQPITVEYAITEYGRTLKEVTSVIADWGMKHRQRIMS